jgi:hypothetical protein
LLERPVGGGCQDEDVADGCRRAGRAHGSTGGASAEGKTLPANPYLLRESMTMPTPTIIGGSARWLGDRRRGVGPTQSKSSPRKPLRRLLCPPPWSQPPPW